jgi:hypothetical protein
LRSNQVAYAMLMSRTFITTKATMNVIQIGWSIFPNQPLTSVTGDRPKAGSRQRPSLHSLSSGASTLAPARAWFRGTGAAANGTAMPGALPA